VGPDLSLEHELLAEGLVVAGIDEVGRGAWAGPLTVGAAILDPRAVPPGLRDSKRLRPARRGELDGALRRCAEVATGEVPHGELDEVGLASALHLAAHRAIAALPRRPDVVLIDGTVDLLAGRGYRTRLLIGGDDRSCSIAAASILAKVARDTWMIEQDPAYPRYGFAANKGYPSAHHRTALAAHGPCLLHRRSWRPIRDLLGAQQLGLDGVATTGAR
jgi:ribonuclease HII